MKDQRFYIVTSVGKKLGIINEIAAQFTSSGATGLSAAPASVDSQGWRPS